MSDDKAHEYVPFRGILWPGDWRERAERAEAERDAARTEAEMLRMEHYTYRARAEKAEAERDKWRSIALEHARSGDKEYGTGERLKREADASHAMSTYTVPASGDDVLFERNNLAEALREVNARLVQVTKERNAARRWAKAWKAKAKSVREELRGMTAAYDKAVWGAKARIAQLEHELKLYAPYHVMREQRDAALARAEKCEHERALSQQLREDDHR